MINRVKFRKSPFGYKIQDAGCRMQDRTGLWPLFCILNPVSLDAAEVQLLTEVLND